MRGLDPSKTRESEMENKPKTSTREDSMNVRISQKKNDLSSREIVKDLKLNVSALRVCLRIKKFSVDRLYPKKKTIELNTSQNKTWQSSWKLQKNIFRRFHNSGTVCYSNRKANMIFLA
ncbi:hypothetical protein AVEN_4151-1 [Araneus ventricosus]|uniref:Uncharacterized protein n=1 Tax=Araneus ventricosus TaxID=182803 RepID=A0A4Y2PIT5_ARAVE|nr:hypothetical protein AVEN_4151-1 [Araneus ventricosus]